jgi:hypothetical protein
VANEDVLDLDTNLKDSVSDALRYAACFWCAHLAACSSFDSSLLNALDNFCRKHAFHWVEVLSLVKYVSPAETALLKVIEWCEVRHSISEIERNESETSGCQKHHSKATSYAAGLLQDLVRVLQVFATPIRSHAPHACHSAVVTMPQCLLLETLERDHLTRGLPRLISPRAAHWGPSLRVLEGHLEDVACVAYSPDGTRIVSSSVDHTVRVWSAVTFEQFAELEGHQGGVRSVAFSPDGTQIVSGSDDCTLRIWNSITFEQLAEIRGHRGRVWSVTFSPDGTRIASGSDDRAVRIWDAVKFERLTELEGHQYAVRAVAFSPNGTRIVSGSADRALRIWNAVTFEHLAKLESHQGEVTSVAFSPDGTHIISGSNDHTVLVWNAFSFAQLAELEGHQD